MTYLTVIIPAYNESKLIRRSIGKVVDYLNKEKYSWKIIVVDDGSTDSTSSIVNGINNKNINIIIRDKNTGKGAALRSGVAEVKSKYFIFMDADLSVPVSYINRMLKKLETGSPVVVGSRRIEESVIAKHQSLIRESMGVVFTWLTRIVTGVGLSDFTCGFNGFESKAGKEIFSSSVVDRWSYDAEIIFIAHKRGYEIEEIPVKWANREESRVEGGRAVVTAFIDLLTIRINDTRRIYESVD